MDILEHCEDKGETNVRLIDWFMMHQNEAELPSGKRLRPGFHWEISGSSFRQETMLQPGIYLIELRKRFWVKSGNLKGYNQMVLRKFASSTLSITHFVYPQKILHKHCFQFLLGLTIVPKCIMDNVEVANAKKKMQTVSG